MKLKLIDTAKVIKKNVYEIFYTVKKMRINVA